MPRQSRMYSDKGIYHIMMRGNEKKKIFLDDEDRRYFVNKLFEKVAEEKSDIYAYCLMDNHVHLLLCEDCNIDMARLMKRINVSFAYYFNKKYKRVGHLFQDRYKSEVIDNDDYLLAAVRYIHNNPVAAGIISSPEKYRWSSYCDYVNAYKTHPIVTEKILNIISEDKLVAVKQFKEFSRLESDIKLIDFIEKNNDEIRIEKEKNARELVSNILAAKGLCINDLSKKDNYNVRNEVILKLKEIYGLSARQIEKITNINKGTVLKIFKNLNKLVSENRPH